MAAMQPNHLSHWLANVVAPRDTLLRQPLWWLALGYAALVAAAYLFSTPIPGRLVVDVFQFLPLCAAGAVAFRVAARNRILQPGTRQALNYWSLGLAVLVAAMALYDFEHEVLGVPYGVAVWADGIHCIGFGLIIVGVLRLPRSNPLGYRGWKVAFDSVVVVVATALVYWYLVPRLTTQELHGWADLIMRLSYPAFGLGFLLALNAVVAGGGVTEHRRAFRLLAIGLILYVVNDSIYQVTFFDGSKPAAWLTHSTSIGFTVCYFLFLSAALEYRALEPHLAPSRSGPLAASPLPLIAAGGVAVLMLGTAFQPWRVPGSPLIVGMVLVTVLMIVRQGRTSSENLKLLKEHAEQVANARLHQVQKMETVGHLAGGVAHDFNNLLTTVLAETELLLEDARGNGGSAELRTIREAAQHGADLTRQLLSFSRRQPMTTGVTEMPELIDGSLRMFGRSGADLTIVRQVDDGLWPALIDANQIAQVLLNLLLNARDAMPGGGTITIALSNALVDTPIPSSALAISPGRYVRLKVSDTGTGMDTETAKHIFEPFFTTKESGRGTGLGLPTVLTTLQAHHGGLVVRSVPEFGTTFTLYLPAGERVARSEVKAEGAAEPRARSGIRILVVDDEPAVLDVSRRILERLGYQVQVAADAAEGIRSVEMDEPDLLVSDVMMPGQSGPSMVATLRRAGFEMPVLYVSGYTGDELTRTGTLDSDTALLQKPYTPRELGQRIDQMLDSLPG